MGNLPQREGERRSLIHGAVSPRSSAVAVDDPLPGGQADPRSGELLPAVQPLEHAEELPRKSRIQTDRY
jgi:hypothetical protein